MTLPATRPVRVMPRQLAPHLRVTILGGPCWRLTDQKPQHFTMLVFYRGAHCPICRKYLTDLEARLADFSRRGVTALAISTDTQERAALSREAWGLNDIPIGYDLDLQTARHWGLYISAGRGETSLGIEEPPLFTEPGLFLVTREGVIHYASVQSAPFARPNLDDMLATIDFVVENDYPARGEVGEKEAAPVG